MKKPVFTGAATAIITPFKGDTIDWEAFEKIIEWQIASGIDGIVAAGTTGEGATLTYAEHEQVVAFCVKQVAGRVPVIAGTGSNDTARAIELTQFACKAGADAVLLVTPYYNKATQQGLIASFSAIADASTVPCILYNVPSRTGCNILPETALALSKHPNIAGIKEASGNIAQIGEIASLCGDELPLISGNDDQIVPVLSLGGVGVISVLSNVLPAETAAMCRLFREGDVAGARALQLKYFELVKALFCEVNPIPVKRAMQALGLCDGSLRLPLTPIEPAHEARLLAAMRGAGLNV